MGAERKSNKWWPAEFLSISRSTSQPIRGVTSQQADHIAEAVSLEYTRDAGWKICLSKALGPKVSVNNGFQYLLRHFDDFNDNPTRNLEELHEFWLDCHVPEPEEDVCFIITSGQTIELLVRTSTEAFYGECEDEEDHRYEVMELDDPIYLWIASFLPLHGHAANQPKAIVIRASLPPE